MSHVIKPRVLYGESFFCIFVHVHVQRVVVIVSTCKYARMCVEEPSKERRSKQIQLSFIVHVHVCVIRSI